MDDDVEHQHDGKQEERSLECVPDDAPHRGAGAAITGGHFDLDRLVAFRTVAAEHSVFQDVSADDCNGKFEREQQHDLRRAHAACEQDGDSLIRCREKDCDQRCGREVPCGEQRGRCRGKTALRDGARQRADNRAELRRAG